MKKWEMMRYPGTSASSRAISGDNASAIEHVSLGAMVVGECLASDGRIVEVEILLQQETSEEDSLLKDTYLLGTK